MDEITVINKLFEGKPLACTYQGSPHIPLKALGAALGYAEAGEGLVITWANSWKAEFKEGHHYKILKGKSLKEFKMLAALTNPGLVSPNAPMLVLLTLPGINRTLLLTNKPIGLKLRDWLDTEVLPEIQKFGKYVAVKANPKPKPSVELQEAQRSLNVLKSAKSLLMSCGGMDDKDQFLFRDRIYAIIERSFPGISGGTNKVLPAVALRTVADICEMDGTHFPTPVVQAIGKLAAQGYQSKYGIKPQHRIQQRINGRAVSVWAYLPHDHHLVLEAKNVHLKALPEKTKQTPKASAQAELFPPKA
jgi:prophage antirepressor-like protein